METESFSKKSASKMNPTSLHPETGILTLPEYGHPGENPHV